MSMPPASAEIRPLKAIVLAAGRGERMRPLTDATPKPLLKVHGKPLIEWHLEALARDGVREVVVNGAWLEQQLVDTLGDGSRFGLRIRYSLEGRDHGRALETAGGIAKALPLLCDAAHPEAHDAFWVVSGDIHVPGFRFDAAVARRFVASDQLAHLWLVDNPPYHPTCDFGLDAQGLALGGEAAAHGKRWTYANIALCRAGLLATVTPGSRAALGPLLHSAMLDRRVSAEVWRGAWENVGTPAQLDALNAAA
jgi:MurNAc alpha-1-phosphate uridylyltransferase